jgi:CPA2 family monovalent cation:H+ antiporter-2
LFGVSFALGAFFAGVILSESDLSHKAGEDSLPLQDAFAVLFFVSVGMLFDPMILVREPLAVAAVLLIIVAGKSLAAFVIVLAFGYPMRTALTVSASLAQIGEFSFILAGLGLSLGLLPPVGRDLILAGALLSITLNPLAFAGISIIERVIRSRPPAPRVPAVSNHAVIIGHGRVGGAITPGLEEKQLSFVVVERDRRRFEQLQSQSVPSVFGDATGQGILEAAHINTARLLVIALPDSYQARRVLELARQANPAIEAVVRTHSDAEFDYLTRNGAAYVVMGEREVARAMVDYVLRRLSAERGAVQRR